MLMTIVKEIKREFYRESCVLEERQKKTTCLLDVFRNTVRGDYSRDITKEILN